MTDSSRPVGLEESVAYVDVRHHYRVVDAGRRPALVKKLMKPLVKLLSDLHRSDLHSSLRSPIKPLIRPLSSATQIKDLLLHL